MRILHLVGDREDAGGVLSVIRNFQSYSTQLGWEHVVWVHQSYREQRRPKLTYRTSHNVIAESQHHIRLLIKSIPASLDLRRLLRQEHFDVIHAHSRGTLLVAILVSRWLDRNVVFTNHNYARRKGLYQWAAKRRRMHTVMLTENMAKHYQINIRPPMVSVISACYADLFHSEPLVNRDSGLGAEKIRLVGVGSIIAWKKWDLVVKAIAQLPQAERLRIEFQIWGPTLHFPEAQAYANQLEHAIEENHLQDTVLLMGSTTEITERLREADWFVLPSTNEPCSVALMEALSLGLPALVSESGGCIDILKSRCGLYFRPDDPDDLKRKLQQILNSKVTCDSPAEIRASVADRCASHVVKAYKDLYEHVRQD